MRRRPGPTAITAAVLFEGRNTNGNATIIGTAFNVTSVVRTGTGLYTINITDDTLAGRFTSIIDSGFFDIVIRATTPNNTTTNDSSVAAFTSGGSPSVDIQLISRAHNGVASDEDFDGAGEAIAVVVESFFDQ